MAYAPTSFRLSDETKTAIENLASKRGVSQHEILRLAIEAYQSIYIDNSAFLEAGLVNEAKACLTVLDNRIKELDLFADPNSKVVSRLKASKEKIENVLNALTNR
jgi:predicted transcriptional regulator